MLREEVIRLVKKIDIAFPTWKPKDLQEAVNLWAECMDDIPYKFAEMALIDYVKTDTTGFAPTIGNIRLKAKEYMKDDPEIKLRYWMNKVADIYPFEFKCKTKIEESDGERFYWFIVAAMDEYNSGNLDKSEVDNLEMLIQKFYEVVGR